MSQPTLTTDAVETSETGSALSRTERAVAWALPSLGDVIFVCALLVGLLGLQGRILGVDGDVGWNIALGSITLQHGLPRTEPFLSGMLGQPSVQWEWLAQVVYALAFRVGSLNGVIAATSILMAATLLGLYSILRRHGASPLLAVALTLLGAPLVAMAWTARAQVFSLLFTLGWAEWLWRYWRTGERWRLWIFPAMTALWVNVHAGWVGGIVLLGVATMVAWLTPPARRAASPLALALALGGSLLATLLNPWGTGYWTHLLAFTFNPLIARYTQEYQSPDFHLAPLWAYLGLVFLLVGVWMLAARAGRRIEPLALALCALWTALGFAYVRFVPLWPLICLPYLVDVAPQRLLHNGANAQVSPMTPSGWRLSLWTRLRRAWMALGEVSLRAGRIERLVGRGVWPALAIGVVALLALNGGRAPGRSSPVLNAQWDTHAFPVAAAQRLRSRGLPVGRGYNPYEWGGYLDEALPEYHVFIDSRSDVYSRQFLANYITITDVAPGWDRLLAQYHVQWALLPSGAPLKQALALAGWRCQAEDAQGVATLCVRQSVADTRTQSTSVRMPTGDTGASDRPSDRPQVSRSDS
ncbi:MAG TPA: hypothetical protein VE338_17885 [Ktedonobacterales bacterium]|nr:hypothetical protein [Ktedonobacterales bacterium]